MVDGRGLPEAITLWPGQAADKGAVAELLATHPAPGDVAADRGCDARAVLELIVARGGRGHIPTQRDRKVQRRVDPALYRQRNLLERFFSKLKQFRRVATRYEKTAATTSPPSSWPARAGGPELMRPQPRRGGRPGRGPCARAA